jgi:membrane protease YdiL (CAAX protease family)
MELNTKKLCVLFFSVLVIQFLCRYYSRYFVYGNGFQALIFVLRLGAPLIVVSFYLKIPWKDLGITFPKITRTGLLWFTAVLLLVPACLYIIKLNLSYQSYYNSYSRMSVDAYKRFAVFTFSTLPGWEFLHRGYFLFGLKKILGSGSANDRLSEQTSSVMSILIVTGFETLYHFVKPDMEAFGMLAGSPVLSLIALRTKSILIPFLIHLYIEMWFIIYVVG